MDEEEHCEVFGMGRKDVQCYTVEMGSHECILEADQAMPCRSPLCHTRSQLHVVCDVPLVILARPNR